MGYMKDMLITVYGGGDDAVDAAEKLAGLNRWIPVSERLPDHGGTVVCRTAGRQLKFGRVIKTSKYDGGEVAETYCWSGYPDGTLDVTHWMPLPEPPNCTTQPK